MHGTTPLAVRGHTPRWHGVLARARSAARHSRRSVSAPRWAAAARSGQSVVVEGTDGQGVESDASNDAMHELEAFLRQDQAELAAEYRRIYHRTSEDPGTAGDEGEENWAALLREWLPSSYQVVTKGRVVFPDRSASSQVDVVVLRGSYPPRLLNNKLYLSSGVVAAFECKNTLTNR